MWTWSKHQFFAWWRGFRNWIDELDACEICGNEQAHDICVGCDRRICCMCNSGYYEDAELCTSCRKEITPEEEEEDKRQLAEELAEQCTCPKLAWFGSEPNDSSCSLSEFEHGLISQYAEKVEAE